MKKTRYIPSPMICIGCGVRASREMTLIPDRGLREGEPSLWIRAKTCGKPECVAIRSSLVYWVGKSQGEKFSIEEKRRRLCELSGSMFHPFTGPDAWLKIKP